MTDPTPETTPTRDEAVRKDPPRIWLEPVDWSQPFAGDERTWCQDKVWPEGDDQDEPTEYIRADLASAPAPASGMVDAVAVADLIDSIAKCHSENAMDQAFLDNADEIATAVLKLFADRDGEWACTVNRLEDRIEGLNADLESAVEVAFRRGATEWTRLNYPTLHMRLSDPAALSPAATPVSEAGGEAVEGKLVKRPVAFRICAPDLTSFATLYYKTEDAAREASEQIGVDYEALYVRDGTPLNFEPLAKPASPPAGGDVDRIDAMFDAFLERYDAHDGCPSVHDLADYLGNVRDAVRAALSQSTSAGSVGG